MEQLGYLAELAMIELMSVVDERTRPGHWLGSVLHSLHCFDTVGRVTGRTSGPCKAYATVPQVLFQKKWRKKT